MHGKPLILRRRTKSESTWGNEAGTSNHHISSYIITTLLCVPTRNQTDTHTHTHTETEIIGSYTHTHTETPTRSCLNPSGAAFILDNHASRGFLFIRTDTLQILARQRRQILKPRIGFLRYAFAWTRFTIPSLIWAPVASLLAKPGKLLLVDAMSQDDSMCKIVQGSRWLKIFQVTLQWFGDARRITQGARK